MKKHLSGILALLLLATLLPLNLFSCSEAQVSEALDYALELVENLPAAESDSGASELVENPPQEDPIETESEPEPVAETEAIPETEVKSETVPEVEAVSETEAKPETVPEAAAEPETEAKPETEPAPAIDENGTYDDKDSVALYLYTYGRLPSNYISKKEAEDLGWTGGSLERYAPGKCIGGTFFGNYEGILPTKKGREYHECDIGTLGKSSRGAKRIVWSNDGLIYYTDDHYETFELLYGEE